MVDCERNRPGSLGKVGEQDHEELAAIEADAKALPESIRNDLASLALDPIVIGRRVLQGIRRNELYVLTHPEYSQTIRDRCDAVLMSLSEELPAVGDTRAAFSQLWHNSMYSTESERKRRGSNR